MEVIQQQLQLTASLSLASMNQMLEGLRLWKPIDLARLLSTPLTRSFQIWKESGLIGNKNLKNIEKLFWY